MAKLIFVTVTFLLFSFGSVFAGTTIDVEGLTSEQKAQLVLEAEKLKQIGDKTAAKTVNEWVEVGKNIGLAIASSAQQIGIAADKFLDSKAGKVTIALIIWKVAGRDLIGFIVGVGLLSTLVPLWFYLFRRMCVVKVRRVEYPEKGFKRVKTYEYYDSYDDSVQICRFIMGVVLAGIVVISLMVIF